MAFFGFDQPEFEKEKDNVLEKAGKNSDGIEVFHWGGEDYDGLGDRLQEGGDELNDETFGGAGPVGTSDAVFAFNGFMLNRETGKDFDFTGTTPASDARQEQRPASTNRDRTWALHAAALCCLHCACFLMRRPFTVDLEYPGPVDFDRCKASQTEPCSNRSPAGTRPTADHQSRPVTYRCSYTPGHRGRALCQCST
jgi:hypothetical protein